MIRHVLYVTPDQMSRAYDLIRDAYGLARPAYVDLRMSDPLDWSWNEHRWYHDALYHGAVRTVLLMLERLRMPA